MASISQRCGKERSVVCYIHTYICMTTNHSSGVVLCGCGHFRVLTLSVVVFNYHIFTPEVPLESPRMIVLWELLVCVINESFYSQKSEMNLEETDMAGALRGGGKEEVAEGREYGIESHRPTPFYSQVVLCYQCLFARRSWPRRS